MKEKTISNLNSFINLNKENNGLISNKMSYKNSDKNNIKEMLYQNKNILLIICIILLIVVLMKVKQNFNQVI